MTLLEKSSPGITSVKPLLPPLHAKNCTNETSELIFDSRVRGNKKEVLCLSYNIRFGFFPQLSIRKPDVNYWDFDSAVCKNAECPANSMNKALTP